MKNIAPTLAGLLLALAHAPHALAQASCSSDGTPQPVALFERFVSADCEACWSDAKTPAPSANARAIVLDWIVPGKAGDDAPLSAAATNDASLRLEALGRKAPDATDIHTATVQAPSPHRLRVAHGLAFNDYLGTAIAFAPPRQAGRHKAPGNGWDFYLLLVQAIPAGTDGTPVARHLVRNMLQGHWPEQGTPAPGSKALHRWMETRSMRIAEGAKAEQLHMVGWVQDASGHIVAAAQSVCR